jgi:hypothetical protein
LANVYYWTATQTEFATDLCFKDKATLEALCPQFLHHGIRSFSSPDTIVKPGDFKVYRPDARFDPKSLRCSSLYPHP